MSVSATPGQGGAGTAHLDPLFRHLEGGGLVLHPTQTVYGLGGLLTGPATARLREIKGRSDGGFVVLIPNKAVVQDLLSSKAAALAEAFWPGPLTLVVEDPGGTFPKAVKAKDGSVAVRVCGHPLTQGLLSALGQAITSTSANHPGAPAPHAYPDALTFVMDLGIDPKGIDAGTLPGGSPSTLVDTRGDEVNVLRPGSLSSDALLGALGLKRAQEQR